MYIALNLIDTPPAPPPAPPPPIAPELEPEPPPPNPWQVGLQILRRGRLRTEISAAAPGAGAGVFVGYGALRFDADLGVVAATEIALDQRAGVRGSVALTRVPLTLSATLAARLGALALGPTLGAAFELLYLRGRDVLRPQSGLRFNPGALLALDARLALTPVWGLGLRLGASGFPRAYDLTVDPAGTLGRTPRWWLHARLGITAQFH